MNNLDRSKIRIAQFKWFMGGKAAGQPFPHSPPDSLHLWGPKRESHRRHHDLTLEEGPISPRLSGTHVAAASSRAPGA